MHIAVDARPLCHTLTGIGRYTHNVLMRLLDNTEHRWHIYSDRPLNMELPQLPNTRFRALRGTTAVPGSALTQWCYPLWSHLDEIDVFWAPGQHLPLWLPARIRQVLTVHDLVWLQYPDTMAPRAQLLDRLLIGRGIRRANHILSVSEITADALATRLGVTPERMTVTRLAASPLPVDTVPELPPGLSVEPFLLFVGTLEPRKNLTALLKAFRMLRREYPDHKLVVCGPPGWELETTERLSVQRDLGDSLIFTGYVTDRELHGLYKNCTLLAMPSLYEGFGLPALEALAYDRPVVVSANTEIARLESPLIHTCRDTDAAAIHEALVETLEAPLTPAAPLDLNWEQTARATLEVLTG